MGDRNLFYPFRILALAIVLSLSVIATTQQKEKPKLKDFGSSLKRIKWDPEKKAAVEIKSGPDSKPGFDDIDVVSVETSLVTSAVLVLDARGNPITGLTGKDFVITEDGTPQQLGMFSLGDNVEVPRSIVLVIDYSSSQFPYIQTSIAAAKTLVDKLAPLDHMAIVTDDVELLIDSTDDKKSLKDTLDSLLKRVGGSFDRTNPNRPHFGRSKQYSALMVTLKEAFSDEDQRPIIIFQTDGDELSMLRESTAVPSLPPNLPHDLREAAERRIEAWQKRVKTEQTEFSRNDLYKAVEKSRATIYTVVPGFRMIGLSPDEQLLQFKAQREYDALSSANIMNRRQLEAARRYEEDRWKRTPPEAIQFYIDDAVKVQAALAVVATLTGGWTEFLQQPSQADEIYSRIFSDINRRYVVAYYPINKAHDGKRRKVNITVRDHPEYVVMGHRGYYAPGPDQ
jgi:VWFA-related protein